MPGSAVTQALARYSGPEVVFSAGRVQVVAAGANPVQITRGIDKTVAALVLELKAMSKEVSHLLPSAW